MESSRDRALDDEAAEPLSGGRDQLRGVNLLG